MFNTKTVPKNGACTTLPNKIREMEYMSRVEKRFVLMLICLLCAARQTVHRLIELIIQLDLGWAISYSPHIVDTEVRTLWKRF